MNVTVPEVNDAPTAVNQLQSTAENSALTFNAGDLLVGDSPGPANESGQSLTVTAVGTATHGTVTLVNGTVTYTPDTAYFGPDAFSYTISDDGTSAGAADPQTATATVSVQVTAVNQPPTAVNQAETTAEDAALSFSASDLLVGDSPGPANESDQTLTVTSVGPAQHGTVTLVNDTVTYTPDADYNGPDSFTYVIADDGTTDGQPDPQSATAFVNVTVSEVNDAPTAVSHAKTTAEDTALAFAAGDLLTGASAGPTNESSQTLTVTAVGTAGHGTVALVGGVVTYTPDADYNGPDSFTYTITDDGTTDGAADPLTATATVNVTVTEVNDQPSAADQAKTTAEDAVLAFPASDLLIGAGAGPANESGQTLTVTGVGTAGHGAVTLVNGVIAYTPDADYNGPDSFTYTISDDGTTAGVADPLTATATVNVTVTEVNDQPSAVDQAKTTAEDAGLTFDTSDLLVGASPGPANESSQTLSVTAVGAAGRGTAVLNGDGTITYTPDADYNGADSFTYTIADDGTTDGAANPLTATATVHVTVTEVNDQPSAVDQAKATAEDAVLTFDASDLLAGASAGPANESSQTLSVTSVGAAAHGTVTLVGGTVTYTPDADYNGPESFTFTIADNGTTDGAADPLTATATVNVTVSEVNDAPTAVDQAKMMAEDAALTFAASDLLVGSSPGPANETGQTLSVTAVGTTGHGTAVLNGDGTITYTPDADYNGPDGFTYTIADDGTTGGAADPLTATATVNVTVSEVNDAPTTVDQAKMTTEDAALTFAASDLLAGASPGPANETGQTLSVTAVGAAGHGTAVLNGNGTITYTPDADYNGPDSFAYTITDDGTTGGAADPLTATATVNVNVTEVNDQPSAIDQAKTATEDAALSFAASDLLTGASAGPANESSQTLSVAAVGAASHGTVTLVAGTITYTPDADYNGPDSFTYTIADDGTTGGVADPLTTTATVNVTVTEVNDAPTAADQAKSTAEDAALSFPASDLLAGASPGPTDESSQTLAVTAVGAATHGTVTLVAGTVTYTHDADYNGPDSFTYVITDDGTTNGLADPRSTTATVNVTVTEVNDAPTAVGHAKTTAEDATLSFAASDLLAGASAGPTNESSQTLTVTAVGTAGHGTVALVGGVVTYTPDADYNGSDSFTYTITDDGTTDGVADPLTATATVNVTITEVNDQPSAVDQSKTTAEDAALSFASSDLLAGDAPGPANESSQTLIVTAVGAASHGTVKLKPDGTIVYTPAANYNGADSFTYTILDNGQTGGSPDPKTASATVHLTVSEVNDAPTALDQAKTATEDTALSFPASDLLSGASAGPANESGQNLAVTAVGSASHGVVVLKGDGTITYTPDADYNGPDSFTYTITDDGTTNGIADPLTATAAVQLTVTEVNDAPAAIDQAKTTNENAELSFSANELLAGASAGPANESSQTLVVTAVGAAAHGTTTLVDGTIVYTPDPNYFGDDAFTYAITDNGTTAGAADPLSATATVHVTVGHMNQAPVVTVNDFSGQEGMPLDFSDTFADADPLDLHTAVIDWGDGTTSAATVSEANGQGTATGSHIYAGEGDYHVTVQVTDNGTTNGLPAPLTGSGQAWGIIDNVGPTLTAGLGFTSIAVGGRNGGGDDHGGGSHGGDSYGGWQRDCGNNGAGDYRDDGQNGATRELAAVISGRFTDPGFTSVMAGTVETFTATVDWGDGSAVETMTADVVEGAEGVLTVGTFTAQHVYAAGGVYTAAVTVADEGGAEATTTFQYGIADIQITSSYNDCFGGGGYSGFGGYGGYGGYGGHSKASGGSGRLAVKVNPSSGNSQQIGSLSPSQIDTSSLRFGPAGALAEGSSSSWRDPSVTEYFDSQATGVRTSDAVAFLSGTLDDGTIIVGMDTLPRSSGRSYFGSSSPQTSSPGDTKFFVPDSRNDTVYRYAADGSSNGTFKLDASAYDVRGATIDFATQTLWFAGGTEQVDVQGPDGTVFGSCAPSDCRIHEALPPTASISGCSTRRPIPSSSTPTPVGCKRALPWPSPTSRFRSMQAIRTQPASPQTARTSG